MAASNLPNDLAAQWSKLITLSIKEGSLHLEIGPIALLLIFSILLLLIWQFAKRLKLPYWWEPVKATLKIANLGEIEIRPNEDIVRVAYQAWIEIATRKVALRFDEKNDVIIEIYQSWYQSFGVLRNLAKSIPAHRLRKCEETRKLVDTMLKVLNYGLRPHLTQWQAKFCRWYENEKTNPDNSIKTPQEIQRAYPQYEELVADLKEVNCQFVEYADWLGAFIKH